MDGLLALGILLACYFFPTFVAMGRWHRNRAAIAVLNIFLGWTGLGWVAALVWACTSDTEPARVRA